MRETRSPIPEAHWLMRETQPPRVETQPRLAVPPRNLAATITAQAVLRGGWAVAGVFLALCLIIFLSLWVDRGYGVAALLPLTALVAIAAALGFLIRRPNWRNGVLYLLVGTVSTYLWVFGLLALDPTLNTQGTYLVNRMVLILLLVGAVSSRLVHGVLWCTAGWVLGSMATALGQWSAGAEFTPGYGPVLSLLLYIVIIVMFVLVKQSQRKFNESFSALHIEPAKITGQREMEERAVALIHDTVLNDLVVIAHGKHQLDERTRTRFREDIRAVTGAGVEPESVHGDSAVWLRSEILATVSDLQWRGLRVDVTGNSSLPHRESAHVAQAIAGAIRACLENVVRHSSSDSAELFMEHTEAELSVMIVDHGVGFDLDGVPADRLGIRQSIVQRIEAIGGNVKIWTAPGTGTSVVIVVPLVGDDD